MSLLTDAGALTAAPGATKSARGGGPGAPAADKRRIRSAEPADFPAPGPRQEDWRFTPLPRLAALLSAPDTPRAALPFQSELPAGASWEQLPADAPLLADLPFPADQLAARARRQASVANVLQLTTACTEPVVVRLTGDGQVSANHLVVRVAAGAEVTVVLEHAGSGAYAASVSVLVGDRARCSFVSVQDWQPSAVHAAHHGFRVGRDASLQVATVSLGADLIRIVETVEFTGPGAQVELAGLQLATGGQHQESRLSVEHSAPHCRSRVLAKAVLAGADTHTVWVGDVLIGPGALGTDTYETNRNLVLSDGSRADSVPNLEIETGEVTGAGHASATGRFDDEQLFYLTSRGIPAPLARRLVVRGFFADVLARVQPMELRSHLAQRVEQRLGELDGRPA